MTDQPKPEQQDGDGLLHELIKFISSLRQRDIDPELRDAILDRIIALPAYTAPPSSNGAEGAGDLENLRIANYRLYEALEHMEQTVEAQKDWTEKCASRRVIAEDRWREVAMENAQLRAALSPATGATEPVAAAWGRVIDGKAVTVSRERTPANDEPLYTAPLVRGDREKLHDAIMGAAKLHTHDHAMALKIADDAILSLPVQPGAGEGECGISIEHRLQAVRATAIEECAKVAEQGLGVFSPLEIARAIRALSRQPQPSSEGGERLPKGNADV